MFSEISKRRKLSAKIERISWNIKNNKFWDEAFNLTTLQVSDGVGGKRRAIHHKGKTWHLYLVATAYMDGFDATYWRSFNENGDEEEIKLSRDALRKVLKGKADIEFLRLKAEAKAELKLLKKKYKKMRKSPVVDGIFDFFQMLQE